jgi:hypothetical protein
VSLIDLAQRRSARSREDSNSNAMCSACGGEWFELRGGSTDPAIVSHGGVALETDGTVRAYYGNPHCLDCGQAWA